MEFILPALCIHCSAPLPSGQKIICPDCFTSIPRLDQAIIDALNKEIVPAYFDALFVVFPFNPLVQHLIHLLKYQRARSVAGYFAEALNKSLGQLQIDLICATPLHKVRQRERGYNQSAEIGRCLADLHHCMFDDSVLERIRNTRSQTQLNREHRKENVSGAFKGTKKLAGKTVLIVDDVITTGSTLNACAREIRKCGAGRIIIAAMATPVDALQRYNEKENSDLNQALHKLA